MKTNLILQVSTILTVLGLPLAAQPQTLSIPHLTRDGGGFVTEIVIENDLAMTRNFVLYSVNSEGVLVPVASDTVAAKGRLTLSPDKLAGDEEARLPYLRAEIDDGLRVGVNYRRVDAPAARTYVPAVEKPSRRWALATGKWDEAFDGVALVNEEPETIQVTLIQRNAAGAQVAIRENVLTLPAHGKGLFVLSDYFNAVDGSVVELTANGRMSALGLRGSLAGGPQNYLIGNTASKLSSFPKELEALYQNRQKWAQAQEELYNGHAFEYQLFCFCDPRYVRAARVAVAQGEVTDVRYLDDNSVPEIALLTQFTSIDALFDAIEETLAQEPYQVSIQYDEQYGYPTEFAIDWALGVADDGTTIVVSNLTPLE